MAGVLLAPRKEASGVELDGQPVFIVHAAPAKGRQRLIYLDAENGLTRGYNELFEIPGLGMVGCEVRTEPIRITHAAPMLGTWTYPVEKIETRLQLDEDPFTIK